MTIPLLIWLLLPTALMVSLPLPSLAIGLIFSSFLVFCILIARKKTLAIDTIFFFTTACSAVWVFANPYSISNSVHEKQILSIIALIICGFATTSMLQKIGSGELSSAITNVFWLLLLIGIAGTLDIFRIGNYQYLSKPIPPFSEPSHFALIYAPFACAYAIICPAKIRLLLYITNLSLSLIFPSLTLFIATLLILIVTLTIRQTLALFIIAPLLGMTLIGAETEFLDYFLNRVTESDAENLSRLVYIQGWESIESALDATNWLGVGFQNLGTEPPGKAAILIEFFTSSSLNRSDGSFLAAKLIGEFGFAGIIAVTLTTVIAISSGLMLRKQIKNIDPIAKAELLPLCFAYMMLLEIYIRGMGYFSPSLLISIYFLPYAFKVIKKQKPNMTTEK